MNDFQYFVLDLNPDQAINVRRNSGVALLEVALCGYGKGRDEEGHEVGSEECDKVPSFARAISETSRKCALSPFLEGVKEKDLTGRLWTQLRRIGAGDGEDRVLDLVLALVCLRIVQCDAEMSLKLCKQTDFQHFLTAVMGQHPASPDLTRHEKANMTKLTAVSKSMLHSSDDNSLEPSLIALNIIARLAEHSDRLDGEGFANLALQEGRSTLSSQMWSRIASEARLASMRIRNQSEMATVEDSFLRHPDGHVIGLIAQIFTSYASHACIDGSIDYKSSVLHVVTLLRFFALQLPVVDDCFALDDPTHFEPLCSLLRMVVAIMATLTSKDWSVASLLKVDEIVPFICRLAARVARTLTISVLDGKRGKLLDICNLCLALLTDLLVSDTGEVRRILLSSAAASTDRPGEEAVQDTLGQELVGDLAHLLRQQREKTEAEPDADYLMGSLAVILALLIIKDDDDDDDDDLIEAGEETERNVLAQLSNGLQAGHLATCLGVLIASLDEFAAMMEIVSSNCYTLQGMSRKGDEARKDALLFRRLSKRLSTVRQHHSSPHRQLGT
jgi:hypothetical protein